MDCFMSDLIYSKLHSKSCDYPHFYYYFFAAVVPVALSDPGVIKPFSMYSIFIAPAGQNPRRH